MKTNVARVSLSFADGSDARLESAARAVLEHVYDNPAFPDVPVPAATLRATLTAFSEARAAKTKGGKEAAAGKNHRRIALVRLLQQVAFHVQIRSANNPAALRSSGFKQATQSLMSA